MDKLRLIMDCDCTIGVPGCDVDDGLALLYVLGCPEAELLGVTCSFGNNTQDTVYRNTKRLLKEWGREDIPVLRGADSPKERRSEAAEFMSAAARELGGGLNLLVTGCTSNLAGAEQYDGGFFGNIAEISLMGGITGPLMVGGKPMAELNLSADSMASLNLFQKAKSIRIATAQNCLRSYFTRNICEGLLYEKNDAISRFLLNELEYWFDLSQREWNLDGMVNWDVMAAAQLIHPEYFDMKQCVITPTEESLKTGLLLGGGKPRQSLLPEIADGEKYVKHIYDTYFNARVLKNP